MTFPTLVNDIFLTLVHVNVKDDILNIKDGDGVDALKVGNRTVVHVDV